MWVHVRDTATTVVADSRVMAKASSPSNSAIVSPTAGSGVRIVRAAGAGGVSGPETPPPAPPPQPTAAVPAAPAARPLRNARRQTMRSGILYAVLDRPGNGRVEDARSTPGPWFRSNANRRHPVGGVMSQPPVGPRLARFALDRLGYGPRPDSIDEVLGRGLERWVQDQLAPTPDGSLDTRLRSF